MQRLVLLFLLANGAPHWVLHQGECDIKEPCIIVPASSNNSCIYEAMLEPGWEVRGYNATLRESSFSKYCILQTSCEFVTCEPGSTKRTNAAEIVTVPVHQHDPDWWMEFCEKVGCVDQVVLEATTMPALGAQQQHACCQRMCRSVHCPAGFERVPNATLVHGDPVSACCRKMTACKRNSNYKPVDMLGIKPSKVQSAAECYELCERTPRCAGFSWFADTSCHLADASAKLQFGAKSVSGTSSCYATRSDMLRDEAELMNGPPSSYCQRQQGRCTGRLWERFGPKPPSPKTPVSLDVADWDGDGTLEIVTLSNNGVVVQGSQYIWRQGNGMTLRVAWADSEKSFDLGNSSGMRPQFSVFDWDADGHLDVLIGSEDGSLGFFKGIGDGEVAFLVDLQPFSAVRGYNCSAPAMTFWNEDNYPDLVLAHGCQVDILLGTADGSLEKSQTLLFANIGACPSLAHSSHVECSLVPAVWDWDGDGRPDVIVGDKEGKLHLCSSKNELQCSDNEFGGLGVGSFASPAACDWDHDGAPDLLVARTLEETPYRFRRNESSVVLMNPASPLDHLDVGANATPVLVDWDLDGHLDLVVGSADGRVRYFPWQNGTFHPTNDLDNPFQHVDVGSQAAPAVVDWDFDGYLDLVVGSAKGTLSFFRGEAGGMVLPEAEEHPFRFIHVESGVAPAFADWDGDGDFDLAITFPQKNESGILYFSNKGGKLVSEPSPFSYVDVSLMRGSGVNMNPRCMQLVDFDGDLDLDLLVGTLGRVWFLEQFDDGTFYHAKGRNDPFDTGLLLSNPCPAFGDIDRDGVADLVVGDSDGRLMIFQHKPVPHMGLGLSVRESQNPLAFLRPRGTTPRRTAAVDWDGDGRLDLIVLTDIANLFLRQADGHLALEPDTESLKMIGTVESSFPGVLRTVDWDFDGDTDFVLFCVRGVFLFERIGDQLAAPKALLPPSAIVFGGDVVDWDDDGDWDMVLIPTRFTLGIQLALQENSEFHIVSYDENPFRAIVLAGNVENPTLADLDGDGRLELLVGRGAGEIFIWRQDSTGVFVHQDQLDARIQGGYSYPMAVDWDGDDDLEIIVGSIGLDYFEFGGCELPDACFVNGGFCHMGACECARGHDRNDCSGCAAGYSTISRSSQTGHQCHPCPGVGSAAGPCSGKGQCFDDKFSFLQPERRGIGNSSCVCNTGFFGVDCSHGECPPGTDPTLDRETETLHCRPCMPGLGKPAAGNDACQPCQPGMFSNGSGFCQPCKQGMHQTTYGMAACELCPAGKVPSRDATYCWPCPQGTYATTGNAICHPCDPGSYQHTTGQTSCQPCPAGFSTDGTSCSRCPANSFSKTSLMGCQPCRGFTKPNQQRTGCVPSWAKLAGAIVFLFFAAFALWLLPYFWGIQRHIADVAWSHTDEAVIVTTQRKHNFGTKLIAVVFEETGVPWLDKPSTDVADKTTPILYVKKTSPTQMRVYAEPGLLLCKPSETSIGSLRPRPFAEAFGSCFLGIPLIIWMGVSIAGMIAMALLIDIPWWYFIVTFSLDLLAIGVLRLLGRRRDATTPLRTLLDAYKVKLVPANPLRCPPGPRRSVSAGKLGRLEEHFRPILQRRTMYYVCPNIVKPLTQEKEVSFAELVGCGSVDWFISHFWGLPFGDFIQSTQQHARHHAGERWEEVRYWICTFSNNQWKLEEEIPRDAPPTESSFYKALVSPTCHGTGMMMDVDVTPLKRSWCLFEMLHTFRQRDHAKERALPFQGLFMLTPQGVLNTGRGSLDTALRIGQKLTTLKLEEATATNRLGHGLGQALLSASPSCHDTMKVRAQEGGFPAINNKLRSEICQVLEQMASTFNSDLSELTQQLRQRNAEIAESERKRGEPVSSETSTTQSDESEPASKTGSAYFGLWQRLGGFAWTNWSSE
ncbi:unnamed protein product [Durusdinium trenchii]|uniref:Apple domain-containing protein n=1 Tax=Durusdinium trenchii TaxID=1381693 RepID=A0ABP0K1D4_9DINO